MVHLYERHETPDTVQVRFRYLPLFYVTLLIAVALSLISAGQWTNPCMSSMGVLLVALIIGLRKPMREVHKAMKTDGVVISGSKFSFTNPLTIVIKK